MDPNLQNCQGETALHIADRCGHYDIVKKLIEAGAYLYIRDNSGKMELDLAYKYRNLNIKALLKETEEKRRTSATVCQIQLIDLPTNNEDTSLSESNDLLTKVIQNTILNDDQISEKENNSELEEFVSNLSSEKKDMLDMCVDSAYSSLTDVSMSANNNRENDSEKPPFHYKKNLLSRHCKQSEPIDLSTSTEYTSSEYQTQPLDLSTSNANNKRPCADIDKQNDNATNKIRRTEIHQKVEPSTSLSFTGEPNILLVCEDSRMIK
ncbi:ankyrin repeat domain-containing protein [Wolbachia endosymbiont of Chironomus riparius]|uniref:ankyrin repeat domain-containing protein n=1 Tax=Wolbachia endosymbiont of Chironomus riparius TaxID=2883238 RepID=UPI0020A0CB94|nr:ankyrin repeat domain-containing protein [Wolbachia endosymbiont of Chironomus riparius]